MSYGDIYLWAGDWDTSLERIQSIMDAFQETDEAISGHFMGIKRHQYQLLIPDEEYQMLRQMAIDEDSSTAELLRRSVRLYLLISRHSYMSYGDV